MEMNEIQPGEVRRQLDRILTSIGFREAGRLGPFLAYLVETALAGEPERIKESVIGVDVFRRPPDYDPRTDPIVRVEARRLRSRLSEYYQAHADPVVISLPKGGYVPRFEMAASLQPVLEASAARGSPWRRWAGVAGIAALAYSAGWWWLGTRAAPPPGKNQSEPPLGGPAPGALMAAGTRTSNLSAYNDYLRARFHRNRFSLDSFLLSNRYAEQALRADPGFAPSYALLSSNHAWLGYYDAIPQGAAFARAKDLALRAIAIDANSGEAHAALGCALALGEYDWAGAARELARAVQLSPRTGEVRAEDALCRLLPQGRLDEAEAQIKQSIDLDPLAFQANFAAGYILLARGKFDEAVKQYDRVTEIYSEFDDLHCDRAMALAYAGRLLEARLAYERVARMRKQERWTPGAVELALLGDRRGALEAARRQGLAPLEAARAYGVLGEKDRAFAALDRAFRARETQTIFIRSDPRLAALRSDARFRKFEELLKLP